MTDWTMQSTERDLSRILGEFFRRRTASAKDLARLIDCEPRTAEGFRAGRHWPQAKHWPRIVGAFGRDVTEAVFHPDAAAARLQEEVADLEAKLAERRAVLRLVAQEAPSVGAGLASPAAGVPAQQTTRRVRRG